MSNHMRSGMGARVLAMFLTGVAALLAACASEAMDLYVSTDGSDAWSGKLQEPKADKTDGPFATFQRAAAEVRKLRESGQTAEGGIRVVVDDGAYCVGKPLELALADSGTDQAPVTYVAAHAGKVRLIGGKFVRDFKPVTDAAVLNRLEEGARSKVVQADLKALGISDFGTPLGGGIEVFFQGKPMQIARWPNEGFTRIVEEAGGDKYDIRGTKGDRIGKWVYEGDRPKRWVGEKDIWVHGYWFWDWSDQRHKVKAIDTEKRTIEVEPPYHGYGYRKGQWYYAYNVLAELDQPGEWYVDRDAGILYFWPPEPIAGGELLVSVLPTLVTLKDVSHVTLRGFMIEGVRATPVTISGGTSNRVIGCTVRNVGGSAISLSGGKDNGVVGCDLYNMGGAGISLDGGDRATLTPAGLFAENNHIHDYGRWYRMYNAAISLGGVGNRASHNLIHDAPHIGVVFGGNDHVIEFNEIHSVCYESNDAGAIYAGRDWTMRGTVIRNNYMHDISGFEGRGCVGVYLDDMYCGTTIASNLFYRVTMAAFIGGGRDNRVENNLFVDCKPALHIDSRALGWAGDTVPTTMKTRLDDMPYKQVPWNTKYPELLTLWNNEPAAPKGNKVIHNVSFSGKWDDVDDGARKFQSIESNLVDQDPQFATPDAITRDGQLKATDFALKADSPAFGVGFKALPLDQMGLVKDDTRASWPVEHQVRPVAKPK